MVDEHSLDTRAKYSRKASHPDGQCGCGPRYSPRWLQWFRWPPVIVAYVWFVGVVVLSNNSYFGATLSTVERRFGLSSTQSTFLSASNDLSSTFVTVFIAFFSERTSRPIWIAGCLLCLSVGNIMTALPHFLSDPLDPEALAEGRLTTVATEGSGEEESRLCTLNSTIPTGNSTCTDAPVGFGGLLYWSLAGQLLIGIGQAGWTPVLIPYFDDLAGRDRRRFVLYYAAYSSIWIGSGSVGYLFGGAVLNYYVDFERISPDTIPTFPKSDPRWIGAWWMGFVFVAAYLLLAAISAPFLPKDPSVNVIVKADVKNDRVPTNRPGQKDSSEGQVDTVSSKVDNSNGQVSHSNGQPDGKESKQEEIAVDKYQDEIAMKDTFIENVKVFLPVLKRVLGRPVLVLYVLFNALELACLAVFQQFIVKYMQYQFGISADRASLLNAAVLIPCSLLGLCTATFVCRYFRLTLKQCAIYVTINNIITVVLLVIGLFIRCKNPAVVGVNQPYSNGMDNMACNAGCSCTEIVFNPVCDENALSYLSPCDAGCQVMVNNLVGTSYTDCTCVTLMENSNPMTSFQVDEFGSVKPGLCEREPGCERQLMYIMIVFGLLAFCRYQDNPTLSVIVLGNSEKEVRTTVFGLNKFFISILGFFPTPIYFGAIVNSTCALWQYVCGKRASCWLYDTDQLRYALFGINIGFRMLQLLTCVFIVLTFKESLRKKPDPEDENTTETVT